jgi:hypothetical protein
MPKLPQFQASSQLRTAGAVPRAAFTGAVGEAVAGIGRTVSRLAGESIQRQKDADDAAFVTERTNRLFRQESELITDVQTRGADVDMEELQGAFDDRVSGLSGEAPSEEAAAALRANATDAFERKFFPQYSKHQAGLNVQKRVSSTNSAIDDIQSEVLRGVTGVPEARGRINAALSGLSETSAGVVDIDAARQGAFNQIATNALGGRIDRGDSRAVVDEIKEGKWDDLTDSKTLGKILNLAEKDVKQRDSAEKEQFAQGLDDYVAFLSSGQEDGALATRFSADNINRVFGDERGAMVSESINDARSFGQAITEVKTAGPEELRGIVEAAKPTDPENFRRESKQFGILAKAIQARNKAIAADPSAYVIQNSNVADKSFQSFQAAFASGDVEATTAAAQEYSAIQRSMQEELGVHPQGVQLLPTQFEDQISATLNDFSQGGEAVALQLDALKTSFGGEWGTVMRQLSQNKKLGGGLKVMAGMDFGPEMVVLGEALSVTPKQYKEFIGDDDFKDIQADTIEELEDFQNTLRGQPGAEQVFIQHKTAIESLAMKYIADGIFDDTGDAIEQARTDVLDSRFTFTDTYRIPTRFSADEVELGVSNTIDSIREGGFNLLIPESDVVENIEDRAEVYLSALRPQPITDPNGEGILFTDQNGNAIFTAEGDPLIIPFKQLEEGVESVSARFATFPETL